MVAIVEGQEGEVQGAPESLTYAAIWMDDFFLF